MEPRTGLVNDSGGGGAMRRFTLGGEYSSGIDDFNLTELVGYSENDEGGEGAILFEYGGGEGVNRRLGGGEGATRRFLVD